MSNFAERVLAEIFALALLATSSALAEPKHDIRGFYPGMPKQEFDEQFEASKCKKNEYFGEENDYCKDDQGTVSFVFSKLEGKPLKEIVFAFQSGTAVDAMVAMVAQRYSVPAPTESKTKANIRSVIRGSPVYSPGWFGTPRGLVMVPGGMLAKWQLSKELERQLDVSNAQPPFEYKLFLTSAAVIAAEKDAAADKKRAEEAAKRAVNPAPKF